MRVVIVGGGVMGCATALELASRGVRDIVLLERAVPGAEASSAAAGMLAAQIEAHGPDELTRFVGAREAYRAWAEELRERTGIDIGYRPTGALSIARTEDDAARLRARVEHQKEQGLDAAWLDRDAAREREPELRPDLLGAAFFPKEAQVDPPQLLRALVAAIARTTVDVRSGRTVASLLDDGRACTGVRLQDGGILTADATVLAAGSWSSQIPGIPASMPVVRPIRGQLALLEERPPRLRSIVFSGHVYAVPRGDGRVVCGATMEDVGHARALTAGGIHDVLGGALALAPRLAQAEFVRAWCNFRPHVASDDGAPGEPLVGRCSTPGLLLATGHHRNGILLAKATAEAVADAVLA